MRNQDIIYYKPCGAQTRAPSHKGVGIFHVVLTIWLNIYLVSAKLKFMLVTIFNCLGLPLHFQQELAYDRLMVSTFAITALH